MKNKKILFIILVLIMLMSLFACKKNNIKNGDNKKIGFVDEKNKDGNDVKVYVKENGEKLKDEWIDVDDKTYYFNEDNSMQIGYKGIDNKEFYFKEDGSLQKEEFSEGNNHYILNDDYSIKEKEDIKVYKKRTNPSNPSGGVSSSKSDSNGYYRFLNNNQKNAVDNAVNEFYDNYINEKIDKTEEDWKFKREMAIVKYLVENTEYDYENYYANTIPEIDYSSYAALINKSAVCDGFSSAFALLCEKCDIPVIKVIGDNHAWNMVELDDGKRYHVDSTWAVCSAEYEYNINLTDDECKNMPYGASGINNHAYWSPNSYVADGEKYSGQYIVEYLYKTYGIGNNYVEVPRVEISETKKKEEKKKNDIKKEIIDGEYIDLSNFEDKSSSRQGAIYNKSLILKKEKWLKGQVKLKYYINSRYELNKLKTSIRVEDEYNSIDFVDYDVTGDINNSEWQVVTTEKRKASAIEEKDRFIGIRVSYNKIKKDGQDVKKAKFKTNFIKEKGVYEGEEYDAICEHYMDDEKVYTVLLKDLILDMDEDCKNLDIKNWILEDYKDEDYEYVVLSNDNIKSDADIKNNNYRGYCIATFMDNNYETIYENEDQPEWDGELCLNIMDIGFVDGDKKYMSGIMGPYSQIDEETGKVYYGCYDANINNELHNKTLNIAMVKPKKVLKGGVEIIPTYEMDSNPKVYEGLDSEVQILMKDGNNVIGRVLIKNCFEY